MPEKLSTGRAGYHIVKRKQRCLRMLGVDFPVHAHDFKVKPPNQVVWLSSAKFTYLGKGKKKKKKDEKLR